MWNNTPCWKRNWNHLMVSKDNQTWNKSWQKYGFNIFQNVSLIVTYHGYADVVFLHDEWCYSYSTEHLVHIVGWLIQSCTYHHYTGTTQSRKIICWNSKRWSYWQVIMLPRNTGKNHKPISGGGRSYKYAIIKQIKHLPFVRHNPRWTTPGWSWIVLLLVGTSLFLPKKLN